jgi:hypothetical protein
MRRLLLLAAAAALAGCHHQNESQTGAAPAPAANDTSAAAVRDTTAMAPTTDTMATPTAGDTSAVTHQVDPSRTGPPGTGGRAPNGTVTADSVGVDSARTQVDTATGVQQAAPQDTLGPRPPAGTTTDTSSSAR